jgi:hypothetical protein
MAPIASAVKLSSATLAPIPLPQRRPRSRHAAAHNNESKSSIGSRLAQGRDIVTAQVQHVPRETLLADTEGAESASNISSTPDAP